MYVLTDGNGTYIREDKITRKYVPVRSEKQAKKWESKEKAKSVLVNSVNKSIRNKYSIGTVQVKEEQEKQLNVCNVEETPAKEENSIIYPILPDNEKDNWLEKIDQVVDVMSNADVKKKQTVDKLQKVQMKIIDVEHYIEFNNLNAAEGWGCYKMLQDLLKERRKYKDELMVIGIIEDTDIDTKVFTSLSKRIEGLKHRSYAPRALPELFTKK